MQGEVVEEDIDNIREATIVGTLIEEG